MGERVSGKTGVCLALLSECFQKKSQTWTTGDGQAAADDQSRIFGELFPLFPVGMIEKRQSEYDEKVPKSGKEKAECAVRRCLICICPADRFTGAVSDEQSGEIDDGADQGMKSLRSENAIVGERRKIKGDVDRQSNPQAVDQYRVQEGEAEDKQAPGDFSFRTVYEGKQKEGGDDDHKLESAAGRGDDKPQTVIDISCAGLCGKRNACEQADTESGGGENPGKRFACGPAVKKFETKYKKETHKIVYEVFKE